MHTLVSASALGFDLSRLPGGGRIAEVMLRALAAEPGDLPILAAAYADTPERDLAWLELTAAGAAAPTFDAAAAEVRRLGAGHADAGAFAVRLLERVLLGSLDGLLTCVRHDVFDWTWRAPSGDDEGDRVAVQDERERRAVAVVCDAVAAGWSEHLVPPETRRVLTGGWVRATRELAPRTASFGPHHDTIAGVLQVLERLPARGRRALADAGGGLPGQWAQSVHEATWAVHLAGRVRPAAAGQFAAVAALRQAGVTSLEAASGAWNAVSGGLQALVVRDLVDSAVAEPLLAPLRAVLGPVVP